MADMIEMKTLTIDGKTYVLVDETARARIPTLLSQLGEDTEHRTVTDAEKEAWNSNNGSGGVAGGLTSADVVDNLLSDSATLPLSARQGKEIVTVEKRDVVMNADNCKSMNGTVRYYKALGLCVMDVQFTTAKALEGGNGTMFYFGTLADDIIPNSTVALSSFANISGTGKLIQASTGNTGNVGARIIGTVASDVTIHINGAWSIADVL